MRTHLRNQFHKLHRGQLQANSLRFQRLHHPFPRYNHNNTSANNSRSKGRQHIHNSMIRHNNHTRVDRRGQPTVLMVHTHTINSTIHTRILQVIRTSIRSHFSTQSRSRQVSIRRLRSTHARQVRSLQRRKQGSRVVSVHQLMTTRDRRLHSRRPMFIKHIIHLHNSTMHTHSTPVISRASRSIHITSVRDRRGRITFSFTFYKDSIRVLQLLQLVQLLQFRGTTIDTIHHPRT